MNKGHCGGSAFAVFGGRGRTVGVLIRVFEILTVMHYRQLMPSDLDGLRGG
jgi:hypothetical protein